jgi:6-phosphogluconolactonase/glucosamine-6-phosphate isomerase/deaminase
MHAESKNLEVAAKQHTERLPINIDILLLGVGADRLIASLCPHDPLL